MSNAIELKREPLSLPIKSVQDLFQVGQVLAQSGLFGEINPAAGVLVTLTCQQEAISPLDFLRRYDIINGKVAKKAKAMLAEFLAAGGRYHISTYTDKEVSIDFKYLDNTLTITTTIDQMVSSGIALGKNGKLKENWLKFPRRMLFARTVSEGVGLLCPSVTTGIYTPEEVSDFNAENTPLPAEADTIEASAQTIPDQTPISEAE